MDSQLQSSYTPSSLKFSSSKLYFQHQNKILQQIWFISPMSIDINFTYTFQEVNSDFFIEWGEFQWLTVDHDIHETWIIYKIWLLHPKFQNIENLSMDLSKNYVNNPSTRTMAKWLIWWGIAFGLLLWLSYKLRFIKILLWINIIWAMILLSFYMWKIWKALYNLIFKTSRVEYGWFKASYKNPSDALIISPEVVKVLKKLKDEYWITKFCYTWNCIYLLQDVHDRDGNRLNSSSKLYSAQEKAVLQQRTMDYIRQSEFLSQFAVR